MSAMKRLIQTTALGALAVTGTFAVAGTANAAHLGFETFDGNICTGSDACTVDGSPFIARIGFNDDTLDVAEFEVNPLFSGVTIDDFTFSNVDDLTDGDGGTTFGYSFTYTPDDGDPLLTAFAAKGGDSYNLYNGYDGNETFTSATFITPINDGDNRAALSNLTFFDTEAPSPSPVPLPAAGWMLLAGIGGLAATRRRRTT